MDSLASNQCHISIVNTVETDRVVYLPKEEMEVHYHNHKSINIMSAAIVSSLDTVGSAILFYTHSVLNLFLSLTNTNAQFYNSH